MGRVTRAKDGSLLVDYLPNVEIPKVCVSCKKGKYQLIEDKLKCPECGDTLLMKVSSKFGEFGETTNPKKLAMLIAMSDAFEKDPSTCMWNDVIKPILAENMDESGKNYIHKCPFCGAELVI